MADIPSIKKAKSSNFKTFYEKLKKSVKVEDLSATFNQMNQELSSDKVVLQKQILEIHNEIECYKRRGTQYYGKLGYALAKLKSLYLKPCVSCRTKEATMFEILSCKRCAKSSKSKDFFTEIKAKINYAIPYINFLIKFGGLFVQFKNFKYTNIPLTEVNKHMKCLQKAMSKDSDFWG